MNYIMISFLILCTIFLLYLWLIMPDLSRKEQVLKWNHLVIAHRGLFDPNHCIPENSMAAFREAVKHHCAIELDLHLTKDNKIVVFHDHSLMRMCQDERVIEQCTYEELTKLHLANTNEHIPLFTDVLSYVNGRVLLLLELKLNTKNTELCAMTAKVLQDYNGPVLIESFNTLALQWFSQNAPQYLRGQLSSNLLETNKKDPLVFRFLVQFLLLNRLGKPDFIAYKLKDTCNISLKISRKIYKVPTAVWTLRTPEEYEEGYANYNMVIMEKSCKKY